MSASLLQTEVTLMACHPTAYLVCLFGTCSCSDTQFWLISLSLFFYILIVAAFWFKLSQTLKEPMQYRDKKTNFPSNHSEITDGNRKQNLQDILSQNSCGKCNKKSPS